MITGTTDIVHSSDWQQELAQGFRHIDQLLDALQIDPRSIADLDPRAGDFPLRVPRAFAARMEPGNADDPLLRQVLPLGREQQIIPGYSTDPLAELSASASPGIIHKYHGRVLLITTAACAVHCRYCFRRHFPYQDHSRSRRQWDDSLRYLRADSSISEVILSGGDPLMLSDERLSELIGALDAIPHLKRLRIHSRMPIVLPGRLNDSLLTTLNSSRLRRSLVIHCNHPRELDSEVAGRLKPLHASGTLMLSQSVLLKGINDDIETLRTLSESLFDHGIMPYYLHLLDPVAGAAHFDLPDATARHLYRKLLEQLPGYLVPKLVRESPELPFKNPIAPR